MPGLGSCEGIRVYSPRGCTEMALCEGKRAARLRCSRLVPVRPRACACQPHGCQQPARMWAVRGRLFEMFVTIRASAHALRLVLVYAQLHSQRALLTVGHYTIQGRIVWSVKRHEIRSERLGDRASLFRMARRLERG